MVLPFKRNESRAPMSGAEKQFILDNYKPGLVTVNSLVSLMGRKKATISGFLKSSGIDVKIYNPPKADRIYTLDEHYFEHIDTRAKAYLLGFLFADGCLWKTKRHLTLQVAEYDGAVVEFLRSEVKTDSPLKTRGPKKSTYNGNMSTPLSWVRICSTLMCEHLIGHGMVPVKSLILKPPLALPDEFVNSFILGYFDGDGSVYNVEKGGHVKFIGTREMLEFISEKIGLSIDRPMRKLHPINCKTKNSYCIAWGGRVVCARIREYLYADAPFFLSRKRSRFDDLGELEYRKSGVKSKSSNGVQS